MAYERHQQISLFDFMIQNNLDPDHKLIQLSHKIDWDQIMDDLRRYYSPIGRRAKRIRMMVGLHMLKHLYDRSDEQVVEELRENVYWMAFCGVPTEEIKKGKPLKWLDSSTMTYFRKRIGPEGMRKIEAVIQDQLVKSRRIRPRLMLPDTTCMEKHIAYPTDSGLLDKGRRKLVKIIRRLQDNGVAISGTIRSYARLGKKALYEINKFGRGNLERMRQPLEQLGEYAKKVMERVPEVLKEAKTLLWNKSLRGAKCIERLCSELRTTGERVERVLRQTKARLLGIHVSDKLYSLHEPQVTCITKGKRGKVHEYGCKVSLEIDRRGYVVAHREYWDNRPDTDCLPEGIRDWEEVTGQTPEVLSADRGYRYRKGEEPSELLRIGRVVIPSRGKQKSPEEQSRWFQRYKRMRVLGEAVISHLKQDHRMGRCRYKGCEGDQINVSLAVMAWNMRKWLRDTG